MNLRRTLRTLLSITLIIGGIQSCATNPVSGRPDLVLMSESQEISTGSRYHKEILKQYSVYPDQRLQAYVNRIGQELAKKSHREHLKFTFTVLDSPEINAFALPGGYIYITRGIMAYLNSEADLAGVIGHEIGHVTARHSVRQQSTETVTGLLSVLVSAKTGLDPNAVNYAGTAFVRGYGRSHELEADRLGAEYIAKIGYDPNYMIEVVKVLKNQELFDKQLANIEGRETRAYHGVFSTHPDNDTRLKEVIQAAKKYTAGQRNAGINTYLDHINGLTFGDSEEQGIVRENRFYHGPLDVAIIAPNKWQITNQPTQLLIHPKDKSAIVVAKMLDKGPTDTAQSLLQSTLGNQKTQNGQPIKNGYTARGLVNKSPWGSQTSAQFTVMIKNNQAWLFIAMAKNIGGLDLHEKKLTAIYHSLHTLTAAEKKLAQPKRITIHTVKAGDSYSKLAKQSGFTSLALEQLRLLNGQYPSGSLKTGFRIKIIR